MTLLEELQEKTLAAHLLVRSAKEWDNLAAKAQEALTHGEEIHHDTARKFHLLAWASVARNLLADPFEGVGITTSPATTDWGIATLTTGKRSCQPQLIHPVTDPAAAPRLRDFDDVMAEYTACLSYLSGATTSPAEKPARQ